MKSMLLGLLLTLCSYAHVEQEYHWREIVLEYVLPEDPLLDELEEFEIPFWFDDQGKLHIVIPDVFYSDLGE